MFFTNHKIGDSKLGFSPLDLAFALIFIFVE